MKGSALTILAAVLLLAASQWLYLWLGFSKLEKVRLESAAAVESLVLDRLGQRLDLVGRLGLEMHNYLGLEREVRQSRALSQSRHFLVTNAQGQLISGQAGPTPPKPEPGREHIRQGDLLWLHRAVEPRPGLIVAHIWSALPVPGFGQLLKQFAAENWLNLMGGFVAPAALLIAGLVWLERRKSSIQAEKVPGRSFRQPGRWLLLLILGPFLLGQVIFYALEYRLVSELFESAARRTGEQAARGLAADLDRVVGQGLPLNRIDRLPEHLDRLLARLPEVTGVGVWNEGNRAVAEKTVSGGQCLEGGQTPPQGVSAGPVRPGASLNRHSPSPDELTVSVALQNQPGRVELRLPSRPGPRIWRELILENLVMSLTAALVLLELAQSLRLFAPDGNPGSETGLLGLRPLAFLTLLAVDLSLSFIPLKMAAFGSFGLPLPPALLAGLPVSAEMALAGLAMLGGGFMATRLGGPRTLLAAGLALAAGGAWASAWAGSPATYILARGLAGLGYGAFNLASQMLATEKADGRGESLGDLTAGFFSGSLCGCAVGGLLADRFSFDLTFGVGGGLLLLVLLGFVLAPNGGLCPIGQSRFIARCCDCMRRGKPFWPWLIVREQASVDANLSSRLDAAQSPRSSVPEPKPGPTRPAWRSYLTARPVWSLALLIIPISLLPAGLVNYFLPLHASALGAGPAAISQLGVLFALIIIGLGSGGGRLVDLSGKPIIILAAAGFLATLALLPILLWPGLAGVALGFVILATAGAVNENGPPAYLLGLQESRLIGRERALSAFNAVGRLGQVLGPLALAGLWGAWGLDGLIWLGAISTLSITAFCWLNRKPL